MPSSVWLLSTFGWNGVKLEGRKTRCFFHSLCPTFYGATGPEPQPVTSPSSPLCVVLAPARRCPPSLHSPSSPRGDDSLQVSVICGLPHCSLLGFPAFLFPSVLNPICLQEVEDCVPGFIFWNKPDMLAGKAFVIKDTGEIKEFLKGQKEERFESTRERAVLRNVPGELLNEAMLYAWWGRGVGGAGTVAGREAPRVPPMLDAENSHSQRCLYYCLSPESSLGISSFMKWASHLRERIGCV